MAPLTHLLGSIGSKIAIWLLSSSMLLVSLSGERKNSRLNLQNFSDDIRDVPGLNYNARNLDHALLTELSGEQWKQIATDLKNELTNEKIEHAITKFIVLDSQPLYILKSKSFIELINILDTHYQLPRQ